MERYTLGGGWGKFSKSNSNDSGDGRATGVGGDGGDKVDKGDRLIEVDLESGDYQQTMIFANGTTWAPWNE